MGKPSVILFDIKLCMVVKMADKSTVVKSIYALRASVDNYLTEQIEKAGAKGLIVSHGNILVRLYQEDEQPMRKIAEDIGKCKSTLTVLVNKLEKAGFITRVPDKIDTRVKKLSLTEKGRDFQGEFWKISKEMNSLLWTGFTEKEQEEFLSYMERMNKNISLAQSCAEKD